MVYCFVIKFVFESHNYNKPQYCCAAPSVASEVLKYARKVNKNEKKEKRKNAQGFVNFYAIQIK